MRTPTQRPLIWSRFILAAVVLVALLAAGRPAAAAPDTGRHPNPWVGS